MAKKVVRVEAPRGQASEPTWKPTPEAKSKATLFRVVALLLWAVAIGIEGFCIFWVLKQKTFDNTLMAVLIGAIVAIGILSIIGSLLWKSANRADPARKSETIRFFIQNQLGAIIAVIAFLPLVVMIFLNPNMSQKQKSLAGSIGVVAMAVAVLAGVTLNSPSVEQYTVETNAVIELTGKDEVWWTKSGEVYHLCEDASALGLESKDNTKYSGTVGTAHAEGKKRLTLEVTEELRQCNLPIPSVLPSGLPEGAK